MYVLDSTTAYNVHLSSPATDSTGDGQRADEIGDISILISTATSVLVMILVAIVVVMSAVILVYRWRKGANVRLRYVNL